MLVVSGQQFSGAGVDEIGCLNFLQYFPNPCFSSTQQDRFYNGVEDADLDTDWLDDAKFKAALSELSRTFTLALKALNNAA